jgi:hypothetical protein
MPKTKTFSITIESLEEYVQLQNGLFQLTEREQEVLAEFIRATLAIRVRGASTNPFSAEITKQISNRLEPRKDHHYWLNNYVKTLKDKGAILPHEGDYRVHPLLIPNMQTDQEQIAINVNWESDE